MNIRWNRDINIRYDLQHLNDFAGKRSLYYRGNLISLSPTIKESGPKLSKLTKKFDN